MQETYFDPNTIISIIFNKEEIDETIVYETRKRNKFLNIFSNNYITGYYYKDWNNIWWIYTEEKLIENGYKIYENKVYTKAQIHIKLNNDRTITSFFNSNEDAYNTINSLLKDRNFSVVESK